jgi:two-component system response regulator AtoC
METIIVKAGMSQDGTADFCREWESPLMRDVQSLMAKIASADTPILVVGEAGSGKEAMVAQIHRLSPRRDGPLRKVGCSALSPGDLEPLLHAADSGGGAGSTLLLDEISELDYLCQARLLELLSSTDGTALGGRRHVWVATTSCRELDAEVRAGRFREDVYYRIAALSLRLPPLRQRQEDIPALTSFFLAKYTAAFGRPRPALSAKALGVLQNYRWPGNIRELENTVKRIVALGDERVPLADIEPSLGKSPAMGSSLKQAARTASRQAEKELILKVLQHTRWNRKRAAQELQISYKALLYKLKQIGGDGTAA